MAKKLMLFATGLCISFACFSQLYIHTYPPNNVKKDTFPVKLLVWDFSKDSLCIKQINGFVIKYHSDALLVERMSNKYDDICFLDEGRKIIYHKVIEYVFR